MHIDLQNFQNHILLARLLLSPSSKKNVENQFNSKFNFIQNWSNNKKKHLFISVHKFLQIFFSDEKYNCSRHSLMKMFNASKKSNKIHWNLFLYLLAFAVEKLLQFEGYIRIFTLNLLYKNSKKKWSLLTRWIKFGA